MRTGMMSPLKFDLDKPSFLQKPPDSQRNAQSPDLHSLDQKQRGLGAQKVFSIET